MDSVVFRRDGFYGVEREDGEPKFTKLPSTTAFLRAWNEIIEIEDDVTLFDLVKVMRDWSEPLLDVVSMLTSSNIERFIKREMQPEPDDDDGSNLTHIEVYKIFEISNYDDVEKWDMSDHGVSAHGIGKPWEHGCEDVPVKDRGNSYAIEFTPWEKMLDLPLRLAPVSHFCKTIWQKTETRKAGFKKKNSSEFDVEWETDRKIDRFENTDVRVTYTVGEFLDGLFDELCFFGSPVQRDKKSEELKQRMDDVQELSEEDFSEYVEE